MDYHGDLYLYNVCLGSNKNILLLLLLLLLLRSLDRRLFSSTHVVSILISRSVSGKCEIILV